jgi:thioredoxin reductase
MVKFFRLAASTPKMNDPEPYDAVVIGGGKGGKTLAMYLARQNYKTGIIHQTTVLVASFATIFSVNPSLRFAQRSKRIFSSRAREPRPKTGPGFESLLFR